MARTGMKRAKAMSKRLVESEHRESSPVHVRAKRHRLKGMSVDDFLSGDFMEGDGDDEVRTHSYVSMNVSLITTKDMPAGADSDEDDEEEEEDEIEDDESFASIDDLDGQYFDIG